MSVKTTISLCIPEEKYKQVGMKKHPVRMAVFALGYR
jgi:hypothetical protein